jgi:putative peptidoglycan lipid II flippase
LTTPEGGRGRGSGRSDRQRPDSRLHDDALFEDTGWHPDLSEYDPDAEFGGAHDGNGAVPGPSGYGPQPDRGRRADEPPAGRHGRHARHQEDRQQTAAYPDNRNGRGYQGPRDYADPRDREDPRGYQDPHDYQEGRGYRDPRGFRDPRAYRDPAGFADPPGAPSRAGSPDRPDSGRPYDPRDLADPRDPGQPRRPRDPGVPRVPRDQRPVADPGPAGPGADPRGLRDPRGPRDPAGPRAFRDPQEDRGRRSEPPPPREMTRPAERAPREEDPLRPDAPPQAWDRRASYHDDPEAASPLAQFSHPSARPRDSYPSYPESESPLAEFFRPERGRPRRAERQEAPPPPRRDDWQDRQDRYAGQDPYAWRAQLSYPEPPTRALPAIMPYPVRTDEGQRQPEPSIAKSSGVMAIGTLASRVTGFLRTLIQTWALGLFLLANAYNSANTLPNVVYNLALGGILTSVIVPLIVNAAKRDGDHSDAYDQRMFTLMTGALLAITLVATLAAAPLVDLYKGSIHGTELHLMVVLAYFFIPQIFFYGMSSLIGAILNARGSFAAPMWTPVVNNVVVIAILLLYMISAGHNEGSLTHISSGQVRLLGLGTTLGIIAQTAALVPALRRVGFRWQPRIDFRRAEVNEIGRMAGWMFCYIGATQIAFLVTTNVANDANSFGGFTAYSYAWQLFQMPYAVVGISVITALLPRMSAHAADGELARVTSDFSYGVRLASVIVVPCSLILAVLGPEFAKVFLAHGAAKVGAADYIGVVFAIFCLGLLPFTLFQLQLRVFYALHDSRTPALIGLVTMTVNIAANLIALHLVAKADLVAGLGVGFGLANLLGTIIAWRILSRRLGGLDGRVIGSTLGRMHAASIPAALLAVTVSVLVGNIVSGPRVGAAITIVLGGGGALLFYAMFARALQVTELTSLTRNLMARFGR